TVTLNFVNADIEAVVKAVSEITGRNFIMDPKVKGTINIVSARPVPRSLVYPTLLSALRLQGITAVEGNGVTKLVAEADAKQHGSEVLRGPVGAGGDRLVTRVITLQFESAAQLVNVLRPLITPNNTIVAYPGSNALVITDYAENLRRIEKIIASLDQPPSGEPVLVTLKHASAIDLVPLVNRLIAGDTSVPGAPPGDVQQRVTVVADARSNSVLLRSDNPGRAARVKALIEQLDTPGRAGGNIFIVYLKNADAARVAQTLRALLSGGSDAAPPPAGPSLAAGAIGNQLSATSPAAPQGAPPAYANPFVSGTGGGGGSNGSGVTIQADTANNALIIMGPEPVYNNLRAIIDRLDVRRAQVFVEALIVEVSADKAAEFGIQWQVLQGADLQRDGIQGFGGTNLGGRGTGRNIIDASVNIGSLAQGLNLGIINGTITIPGLGIITNLALLARALETNANANILSTPTLLTLDNEEARIIVGQNVPFVTGQYATTGSATTVQPFQTVERRDVGVLLRVKPQITEGGSVRLVVYQEVSRVEDRSNAAGIILSKRALESSVVIDDQQIVVLGGLIQDTFSDGTDKIPVAGDVPVIGNLFRYDSRRRSKTNLLVFLKPTVVRTDAQGKALTSERYDYIMNEQERTRPLPRWFWDDPSYPQLPAAGAMPGTSAGTVPHAPPAIQLAPLPPAQ
ncbi:MAG: type II secretion system secretin GspD, partial [Betaproteobacteria bacterium]|nr:type II secretion system secretin GspD [Betaproteobacteria bacterium]